MGEREREREREREKGGRGSPTYSATALFARVGSRSPLPMAGVRREHSSRYLRNKVTNTQSHRATNVEKERIIDFSDRAHVRREHNFR